MRAATPSSFIARLLRRRPRALRAPEPADMGTAFGMEQRLGEREPRGLRADRLRRSWWPRWFHPGAGR